MIRRAPDFDDIAERVTPERLASALELKKGGSSWHCPLPQNHTNGDKNPSFSISRVGGRTVAKCHAGHCPLSGTPVQVAAEVWGISEPEAAGRLADIIGLSPSRNGGRGLGEIVETYPYVDEQGDLLFEVVRYSPKAFRQRAPDGNGGLNWSTKGVRRVLYRLPQVLEAIERDEPIYLVEGEKDVHALEAEGVTATTNPGGAGKWRDEYTETLRGADVRIVADRDEAGRKHVRIMARKLEGVAESVCVLEPAVDKPKADVTDHLSAGFGLEDLVATTPFKETSVPFVRVSPASQKWIEPIPLGPQPPQDLNAAGLPSPLQEHVVSVAEFTQTPVALALGLGLAAVATTVAGKADVEVREGWRVPLNLYTAVVLGPANRKSAVEKTMIAPIRDWESVRAEEIGPEHRLAIDQQQALENRLDKATREFSKAVTAEDEGQARQDMKEARQRLEGLQIPALPRLITNDVTSEALGRLMADQHGRAALVSSEGDALRIFSGRYSGGDPTLDLLKKGWSGDPVRVDRVGRDGIYLPNPLLTVGLALQPTLLETIANKRVLEGEGVLARFLWFAPPSLIGERKVGGDVPPLDQTAKAEYDALIRRLLDSEPRDVDNAGWWEPHHLTLTSEARELLYKFEREVERKLADGGELATIRSWGGKLVGNTVRVAGLLHIVRHTNRREDPYRTSVDSESVSAAIDLARALPPHALHVLSGKLELDPELERARYVYGRIQELDDSDLTVRNLQRATEGKPGLETVEDLQRVLDRLESHHWIRVEERESTGGRPPSPWIHINPLSPETP